MEGKVFADSIETYQINVININKKLGSITSNTGEFSIRANLEDSIVFTSLQHKTYTLQVSQSNLEKDNSIFLELQINELPEVKISQYDLSGDLTKDIEQVQVEFLDQRKLGFGMPRELTIEKRKLRAAYSSSGAIPLDFIIMSLNGQLKKLKQQLEIANTKAIKNEILYKTSADLIVNDLKIPEIYIEDFAYFCAEDDNIISVLNQDNPLAFIDALKLKAKDYLELKDLTK